ncbi:serine hydrolase [Lacipirellula sp.]|uniref:serine hydrolase n=1 Tax=Lacipirellula sp. TaxID=2691419 RepID=UPI003D102C24
MLLLFSRRLILLAGLWAGVGFAASHAAETLAELQPQIEALVAPVIENRGVVGFAIGIRRGDEELFLNYGKVDLEKEGAPTPDTVYEIGSVTKTFTGTLLADASLQTGLDLDATVAKTLPTRAPQPAESEQPITLAHLATHTSGLPRLPNDLKPKDQRNPYADFTADDAYAFFAAHKPARKPGEYEYSNYGMGLLGQLLADRAGKDYEALVIERICEPLGMHDTRQRLTPEMTARLAPPYNGDLGRESNWDFQALVGAGGLRSTARDMLKFVAAMYAEDDRDVTKAFQLAGQPRMKLPDGRSIGLAWHFARDGITRLHDGQTAGYSSFVACIPEKKLAVVVLSNTAKHEFTSAVGEKIAQLALGMQVEPLAMRKVVDMPVETLKKYVGKYPLSLLFALNVTLDGEQLKVQATGQDAFPIYPSSETEFFYRVVDAQITFVVDEKGEATKLILHQNGNDIEGLRQK